MSIEPTPAASRFLTLNGNYYIFNTECFPDKLGQTGSMLINLSKEPDDLNKGITKIVRYVDGNKDISRMAPGALDTSFCRYVTLSPDGKYRHIGVFEPGVKLSLGRIDSNKLKLNDFSVNGSFSKFSPFARKWISKTLKGLADGTVIADTNIDLAELLFKKIKIFK